MLHSYEPRKPLVPVILTLTLTPLTVVTYHDAWSLSSIVDIYATFLALVCASIVLYRLSPFHPLAQYPGPLLFKVTKLAGAWEAASGNYHVLLRDMHATYGPVVRVGASVDSLPCTGASDTRWRRSERRVYRGRGCDSSRLGARRITQGSMYVLLSTRLLS